MQHSVSASPACGGNSTRVTAKPPPSPVLWAAHPSPAHVSRKVARGPSRTTCQAVKATDIQNYDDLATGWKVNPEKRVSQEINPRELLSECQTWQACQALLEENPDRFERNKNLAYFLLLRLADLLGAPEGTTPETSITRFLTLPPVTTSGSFEDANQNGSFSDPFADMLQKQLAREGTAQAKGADRQAALKVVDQVLRMIMGNLDKMKPEHVCGVIFVMCRLGHAPPTYLKTTLLCIKGFPQKFTVAQLFAVLAAATALNFKLPAAWLQAIVAQAQRGLRYATAADMNNAAYALHVYPRGSLQPAQVNSLMRAARPWLFDMTGDGLAFLAAMLSRQAYKPPAGFIAGLMEALGPHWERISDPSTVVAVLLGFSGLKCELHQGVMDVMERVMCSGGVRPLSTEQLGVLGTVLANCAPTNYTPSQQLRASYIAQVQAKLSQVDETTAGMLLFGLAYMSEPAAATSTPSAQSAGAPSLLTARLAKLKAKKGSSTSSTCVAPEHVVSELLDIVEAAVPKMGGNSLRQLATAIAKLGSSNSLQPAFIEAYRYAAHAAVPKTSTYAGLIALATAAGGCGVSVLALPAPTINSASKTANKASEESEKEDDSTLSSAAFAKAVAAQAMLVSQGPAQQPPAATDSGEGPGEEAADFPAEVDKTQYLPTQQELQQLVDALAQLPQVNVAELDLPQAQPPPPQLSFAARGFGGRDRGFNNRDRGFDRRDNTRTRGSPLRQPNRFRDNDWAASSPPSSGWLEDDTALVGRYDDDLQGWDSPLSDDVGVMGGYMGPAGGRSRQQGGQSGGYDGGYGDQQTWQPRQRSSRRPPASQGFSDFGAGAGFEGDEGGYVSGNEGWLDASGMEEGDGFYMDDPRSAPKPRAQQTNQWSAGSSRKQQRGASGVGAEDDFGFGNPEPSGFGGLGDLFEDDDTWFGGSTGGSGNASSSKPAAKKGSFASLLDDFDDFGLDDDFSTSSRGLGAGPQPKAGSFNVFEDASNSNDPPSAPPASPAAAPHTVGMGAASAASEGGEQPKAKAGRGRPRKTDSVAPAGVQEPLVVSGKATSRRRAASVAAAAAEAEAVTDTEEKPKKKGRPAKSG